MTEPDLQPQPRPPEPRTFETGTITLPATDWQVLEDFCRDTGGDLGDWVRFFAQPDASWRRFPGSRTLSGRLRWLADYVRRRPRLHLLEPGQLPADVAGPLGDTVSPDE